MRELIPILVLLAITSANAQQPEAAPVTSAPVVVTASIRPGGRVFITPMDGFGGYLKMAFVNKKVPLLIVASADEAEYIVTGTSHVEQAGRLKKIITPGPRAEASISMQDMKGNTVFTYAVDKFDAQRANQSTAEACAKHLKEWMERKR